MKTRILILSVFIIVLGGACKQKSPAAAEQPEIPAEVPVYQKMIIAKVYIKPGSESAFISEAKSMIENSNKEEGCMGYMLYQDPYEKTNFIFVERYKDQSAVDAHFATPYFSEFGNKIAGMTSDPMEIKIFDIAGEQ
ncbi:MAG: antibiotic biosynthesis monooxygenase [Bacteroidales bacterium]|nr:antibiotic biosynthesis monooxygenase [Bacteroidales bacterium]